MALEAFFALGAFLTFAYFQIRHAKGGYRYRLPILIITVISISAVSGALFYQLGVGQGVDQRFAEASPFYRKIANHQLKRLVDPANGLLAGRVLSVEDGQLQLETIGREKWQVSLSEDQAAQADLFPNQIVRILGQQVGENAFQAESIKTLRPGQGLGRQLKGAGERTFPELRIK